MSEFQKTVIVTVTAESWENSPAGIAKMQTFLETENELDVDVNGKLSVELPAVGEEDPEVLELIPGDWLIKDEDDALSVMDKDEFQGTYRVSGEEKYQEPIEE